MTIPSSFAKADLNDNVSVDYFAVSLPNDNKKQGTNVNIQKAKCNNIIINGLDKSHQKPGAGMPGNVMATNENDGIGQHNQ